MDKLNAGGAIEWARANLHKTCSFDNSPPPAVGEAKRISVEGFKIEADTWCEAWTAVLRT